MGIEPPGADPIQHVGKYVAVYRRQSDGSLKLIVDTFNSDAETQTKNVGCRNDCQDYHVLLRYQAWR